MAEIDRPELLTRGFSNIYVVRALGLPAFSAYSANQTYQTQKYAQKQLLLNSNTVKKYVKNIMHRSPTLNTTRRPTKGKNVIVLHLEKFSIISD